MAARQVAIITGGASGIGRGLAEILAARGTELVLLDVNEALLAETVAAIQAKGGRAKGEKVDVRDADRMKAVAEATFSELGRLDLYFNNAGIAIIGNTFEFSLEDWNRIIDINIRGVIHGTMAAYEIMRRQGFGQIVNIASVAGLIPSPGLVAYATSKHAVVGLSTSLRAEAAVFGVGVTAVCPGFIRTPMAEGSELRGVDRAMAMKEIERLFNSVESCAQEIVRGIEKNPATLVVTGHGRTMSRVFRWFPGLFHWGISRQLRRTFTITAPERP